MTIQDFHEFHEITITDKSRFQKALNQTILSRRLITYTFTNFFMWRNWDNFRWRELEGALCLIANYPGGPAMLPLLLLDSVSFFRAAEKMMEIFHANDLQLWITELDEELVARFQHQWPDRFIAGEYAPGGNYIYYQHDLATLEGKKYDAKRNHLHYFQRTNPNWRLTPITPELAVQCRHLFRQWNDLLHPDDPELALEAVGIEYALDHLDELGVASAALLSNGNPVAFTFGEPLNQDTFCVHVEKADSRIRGSYQAINHLFVKEFCNGYTYINRAEDMGNPGQKRAKESYHPCRFEKKYHLREKL